MLRYLSGALTGLSITGTVAHVPDMPISPGDVDLSSAMMEPTGCTWDTESYPSATKVAEAASAPIVMSPEPYCEKR